MKRLLLLLVVLSLLLVQGCTPTADKEVYTPKTPDTPEKSAPYDAPDTDYVVALIDGREVLASEMNYQMTMLMSSYISYAGGIDWDEYIDGKLAELFFRDEAFEAVKMYRAVERLAATKGFSLTEQEIAAISDEIAAFAIENYGSLEEFEALLSEDGLTLSLYDYVAYVPELYNKMFEALYLNENAPMRIPNDALYNYFETEFMTSRHVLMALYAEDGNYLSNEEAAGVYDMMLYVQSLLQAGEDFLTVMQNFSEDTYIEDSATFNKTDLAPSYIEVLSALSEYEYSDIVQVEDTFCIIQRLPLDTEYYNEISEQLREDRSVELFGEEIDAAMLLLDVEYTDGFEKLSAQEIYDKYS